VLEARRRCHCVAQSSALAVDALGLVPPHCGSEAKVEAEALEVEEPLRRGYHAA
jgi:hypothetical protein